MPTLNAELVYIIAAVAAAAIIIILQLAILLRKPKNVGLDKSEVAELIREHTRDIIMQTQGDSRSLREEVGGQIDRLRDSINVSLNGAKDAQASAIATMAESTSEALDKLRTMIEERFARAAESQSSKFGEQKDSFAAKLEEFRATMSAKLEELRTTQSEMFNAFTKSTSGNLERIRESMDSKLGELIESQNRRLTELNASNAFGMESVRNKVDERLNLMQLSNEKRLDEMRQTVDEKLERTLETRLQKSFETVSTQLESVNRGLGEMRTVAESVGSLNKMLSNSKSRGILGELQLGQIVEDMLPPTLYDREVATVPGSREHVEYAIKLPGSDSESHVYLPIDSKFPLEDFYMLLDGYENGNADQISVSRKSLMARLKQFAKDIKQKYVSPPFTTNFAILFLPTEGLYSEIARDPVFFDGLRRDGIMIAGPTTLSAMLNSLQVGFKTLQIQQSAAEIEKTLGAVKSEFSMFEAVLNKAQSKIMGAGRDIETLVGVRTRKINLRLREIQVYNGEDAAQLAGTVDAPDALEPPEDGSEDDTQIQFVVTDEPQPQPQQQEN